jgi:hypothetical protein
MRGDPAFQSVPIERIALMRLSLQKPTVAIVGNAPEMRGVAAEIDARDIVVRFNKAPGFERWAGRRVTHLALVNRGGQSREWVHDGGLGEIAVLQQANEIIFPFPRLVDGPAGVCWTQEMTMALAPFAVRARALQEELHIAARNELKTFGATDSVAPSTGFLVACDFLRRMPAAQIAVYGFGFAGWQGHAWAAERRWFEHQHHSGRLALRPLG